MKTSLVILFLLAISTCALAQETPGAVIGVDVERFSQVMDSLQDEVVVDLRTPDELKQGKIPGAIVIDYFGSDFESSIKALDKNKTYLLYCAGGGRSGETSELMSNMGFVKVYNLEPGFKGWVKMKKPVEKK